ncbi:MAG: MFS transporter [Actinomycetota bacterium]
MTTAPPLVPPRLWRNTRYVTWLISDTSKGLAAALFAFAIPLLVLIITNDPAQAGIIGAAGLAVRTLTTLMGGVLADRHRRIVLMMIGSSLGIVLAGTFTLLALGDALTFPSLLAINILLAARSGLFDVAGESALKEIVPDAAMGRAQAANQARDAALQLAGGPLGGVLLAAGGWLVGAVMTLCHIIAGITAALLQRMTRPAAEVVAETAPVAPPRAKRNAGAEIRAGFEWLFSRPDLRSVLLVTTVINLGFNASLTTVIYALQQAGTSTLTIGWISTAAGGAMLIGALTAPFLVPRVGAGMLTIAGLTVATVGSATMTLVHEPWAIAVVLAGSVFLLPALNASMMGYFMVATPTELLGRASSASSVLAMGAMPLGPLIAGMGLAWIGRESTILVCAALCAIAAVMAFVSRPLRSLPAESGWSTHAAQFAIR